jgi:hydrogenase expression/formation protein HypE
MRDPTRGGLATVCCELQQALATGIRLDEPAIPVRDPVQSVCAMLGYDPMYLACEGRVVAVIDSAEAEALLQSWQQIDQGREAAIIGQVDSGLNRVVVKTELGGERILEELEDDPLPRIC